MDVLTFSESLFFSAVDDGLLSSSTRDPLGLEVLWVSFGDTVIPHLNTLSFGARNFVVVTAMHWLIDRWFAKTSTKQLLENNQRLGRGAFMVTLDSLLVYSVLELGLDQTRLYGLTTAKRRLSSGNVKVGPAAELQILKSQLTGGHFGRYETPLVRFRFIDREARADGRRVTPVWTQILDATLPACDWLKPLEAELDRVFRNIVKDGSLPFDSFKAKHQLASLRHDDVLVANSQQLLDTLQVLEPGTTQGLVWQQLDAQMHPDDMFRVAHAQAQELGYEEAEFRLQKLLQLESVLARIEALFDSLWQPQPDTPAILEDTLGQIQKADFDALIAYSRTLNSGAATRRLNDLKDIALSSTSADTFTERLVNEYHAPMMQNERRTSPWVDFSSGEATILNGAHNPGQPFDENGQVIEFRKRDYYLQTLASIHGELKQVGVKW